MKSAHSAMEGNSIQQLRHRREAYFDNSLFWVSYYRDKLARNDTNREREYSSLLNKKLDSSSIIADIGVGIGFLTKELALAGFNVIGFDLSPRMLHEAKIYTAEIPGIDLINGDSTFLPTANAVFRAVTASSLIEHFSLDEIKLDLLPEIWRVLIPNGFLFIHVPVKSLRTRFVRHWKKNIVLSHPDWAIDDDCDYTHKIWLTPNEYMSIIEEQGFKLEAYGFQLRHSRTSAIVRLISDIMEYTLDTITNGDPSKLTSNGQPGWIKNIRKMMSTSCYCLFRKLQQPRTR